MGLLSVYILQLLSQAYFQCSGRVKDLERLPSRENICRNIFLGEDESSDPLLWWEEGQEIENLLHNQRCPAFDVGTRTSRANFSSSPRS